MAIKLFPDYDRCTLTEDDKANPHKSAYETYTGIVFDTASNKFTVVTGKFRDKKDMYEKMTKQDKYLRRAYESKIWNWIQDNAETPVDGYLMLSTAVSKWINNNVLSKYYKKLLHDLPYLNREGRKGDPQTMGTKASFESVEQDNEIRLFEDVNDTNLDNTGNKYFDKDLYKEIIRNAKEDDLGQDYVIDVYPVDEKTDEIDKSHLLATYPLPDIPESGFLYNRFLNGDTNKSKNNVINKPVNKIFNPFIYYDIYSKSKEYIDSITNEKHDGKFYGYNTLAFYIYKDKNAEKPIFEEPIIVKKSAILSKVGDIQSDPYYLPGDLAEKIETSKNNLTSTFKDAFINANNEIKKLNKEKDKLLKEKENETNLEKQKNLDSQLAEVEEKLVNAHNLTSKMSILGQLSLLYSAEAKEKIKKLKAEKNKINADTRVYTNYQKKGALADIDEEIEQIKSKDKNLAERINTCGNKLDKLTLNLHWSDRKLTQADINEYNEVKKEYECLRNQLKSYRRVKNNEIVNQKINKANSTVSPKSDLHGGNSVSQYITQFANKAQLKKELEGTLKKAEKAGDLETVEQIKSGLGISDPEVRTKGQDKFASDSAKQWTKNNIYNSIARDLGITLTPEDKEVIDTNLQDYDKIQQKPDLEKIIQAIKVARDEKYKKAAEDKENYFNLIVNTLKTQSDLKNQEIDIKKLKSAISNVNQAKGMQLKNDYQKANPHEFSASNWEAQAEEYYKNNMDEFITALTTEYNKSVDSNIKKDDTLAKVSDEIKLTPEQLAKFQAKYGRVKKESAVNYGATDLMHYTDDLARAEQKNAIVEDTTNMELNQELFDNKQLHKDVREALLKIANEFQNKLKLPFEPVDIYFTGSEANYNYNQNSDIDIHLVYDFEQAGEAAEILSRYLQSAKRIFNGSHDITVKGIPVEVGAENKAEPLVTSGIYSLISDSWIKEPENANVEIKEPDKPYLNEIQTQIENAISEKNKDELENVIKMVWEIRKKGLEKEGEFGPSNTLFKYLRNSGLLTRLKDTYYEIESKDLSLESMLEAEFNDRNELEITEDDLINKSEDELADGLMNSYNTPDEAIAKLEDTLNSCSDGYKEKINNTIKKIKENSNFSNYCRKLVEQVITKLEEKSKNFSRYLANIDELMAFYMNEIHPDFKYGKTHGKPTFRYIDENGRKVDFELTGINDQNGTVSYVEWKMVQPTGSLQVIKVRDSVSKTMPIEKFKEILMSKDNKKTYDEIMKGIDPNDETFWSNEMDKVNKFAQEVDKQYIDWLTNNWQRLRLENYSQQERFKIYQYMRYGYTDKEAINKLKFDKQHKSKYAHKIQAEAVNLNNEIDTSNKLTEAKITKEDYFLVNSNKEAVQKRLENYPFPFDLTSLPFAMKEPKQYTDKKYDTPLSYYIVTGVKKDPNDDTFLLKEIDPDGSYKTWIDKHAQEHKYMNQFECPINQLLTWMNQEDAKKQNIEPIIYLDRAADVMRNPYRRNLITHTAKQGDWLILSEQEVAAVLDKMAKANPHVYGSVLKTYLTSLDTDEKRQKVLDALKDFAKSEGVPSPNVSNVKGTSKYKLFIPKKDEVAPDDSTKDPTVTIPINKVVTAPVHYDKNPAHRLNNWANKKSFGK